ncbi:MAG TPA: helix-turn-helix domain-containing protein [Nitrososphaerales archaeon]
MAKQTDPLKFWTEGLPMVPAAPLANCPIATSLGVLGKKWALLVIRDIAMRKTERFSELLKTIPGITPRVLSMRLKELEEAGIIHKVTNKKTPKLVRWNLTEMGWDALPILMSYVAFGSKWFSRTVFADKRPRDVSEIYPQANLQRFEVDIGVANKDEKVIHAMRAGASSD